MTAVAVLDITIPQGGTYRLVVDVLGGPTTLVGATGAMQVREYKADPLVLADVDSSAFTFDQPNRQVVITIPSSATRLYDWDEGVYDVLITDATGQDWRLVEGLARLSGSVTRED